MSSTEAVIEPEIEVDTGRAAPLTTPRRRAPSRFGRPTPSGWITGAIGALTAVLYTWNLSSVAYGNDYYAAAVRAMSSSWKAFLFGAIDPGSFITVDKPPAALWLQALSVRISASARGASSCPRRWRESHLCCYCTISFASGRATPPPTWRRWRSP
jgi:hypothetical protein